MKRVLEEEMDYFPIRLQVDQGVEFYNSQVRGFLKSNNIELFSVKSQFKAALVERFNRTIKSKLWKYFTYNQQQYRWLEVLPQLVQSYNNNIHRVIKMTPNEAFKKKNENKVFITLYGGKRRWPKKKPKYQIGTYVRISKIKRTFEKGYLPNWTREVFVIREINRKWEPYMYYLSDLQEQEIEGPFYAEELQAILYHPKNPLYEIERIIKSNKNKVLVQWVGYDGPPSWVQKKDLVKW